MLWQARFAHEFGTLFSVDSWKGAILPFFFAQERPFQQKDVQITQNAYNEHLYPTFRVRILVPVYVYVSGKRDMYWPPGGYELIGISSLWSLSPSQSPTKAWTYINGHFRNLNWRYLPYIRPMFQAYVKGYTPKIWPYMVQYLHFRILEFPLIIWTYINLPYPGMSPSSILAGYFCDIPWLQVVSSLVIPSTGAGDPLLMI